MIEWNDIFQSDKKIKKVIQNNKRVMFLILLHLKQLHREILIKIVFTKTSILKEKYLIQDIVKKN